jgi:predicted RNA-binding protein
LNQQFWLAMIGPENFQRLSAVNYAHYAVTRRHSTMSKRIKPGNMIVLFRTRGPQELRKKFQSGFVGIFEVSGEPFPSTRSIFFGADYSLSIPWSLTQAAFDDPIPFADVVSELDFVKVKTNFGMYMQHDLRELSQHDYLVIQKAFQDHPRL